jgi:very-short-patch-repair endonuclease
MGSLHAATLATGGVGSHRSAAAAWDLLPPPDTIDVTVGIGRRPRLAGISSHRCDPLPRSVRREGISVTTPMRTLVDLAAAIPGQELADVVERGLIAHLYSVVTLRNELTRPGETGRPGTRVLWRLLDARDVGERPTESVLEARMAKLYRRFGLPVPQFQFEVWAGGKFIARVDFAYPDLKLAIEVDGWSSRATQADLQRSNDRQNALIAHGWTILRLTWSDVVTTPAKVAAGIGREIVRLRSQTSGRFLPLGGTNRPLEGGGR